jgi:hypothetical protein
MPKYVEMLDDKDCAPDHLHVRLYAKGDRYEVGHHHMPEYLAEILIKEGWAKPVSSFSPQEEQADTGSSGHAGEAAPKPTAPADTPKRAGDPGPKEVK